MTNNRLASHFLCKAFFAVGVLTLLQAIVLLPSAFSQEVPLRPFPSRSEAVPDQYIVQLRTGVAPDNGAQQLARQYGLRVGYVYRYALNGFSAILKRDHIPVPASRSSAEFHEDHPADPRP